MTKDENKKIALIKYNHLNLPQTILFANNNLISYLYDKVGQKVQKQIRTVVATTTSTATTDYLSGFQYLTSALRFFAHAEGYLKVTGTRYNYVYNDTDHLGNVRLSYGLDARNVLTILEENNYYPFGMRHQNYNMSERIYIETSAGLVNLAVAPISRTNLKYNGKELLDEMVGA